MRIEDAGQPIMMSYFAEGATEKANPQLSVAYVVGHELGHASTNRMLAISRGEEVEQNITYNITMREGRLVATGGTTHATFKKKENIKPDPKPLTNKKPDNIQPANPQPPAIYNKHIQALKVKKEDLEQKLTNIKDGRDFAESLIEEPLQQDINDPAIQTHSLGDYIKGMEEERLKREIKDLEKEIKEQKAEETGQKPLSGAIEDKGLKTEDNTTLKGLVFMNSFRFIGNEVPPVLFIDGGGSAIKARDALEGLIAQKNMREPYIMKRLDFTPSFYQMKATAWDALGSRLTELYKANAPLLSSEGFNINTASSSDEDVLTAAASAAAAPAEYKIKVTQLAKAHKIESDSFTDTGTALNLSGTININDFEVAIKTTDSLYAIADKINFGEDLNRNNALDFGAETDADKDRLMDSGEDGNGNGILDTREDINFNNTLDGGSGKHGVSASIAEGRLVLTAAATGKAINIKDDNKVLRELGILSYDPYPLNPSFKRETQAAQKAKITVNGSEYEKDTNEISDAISGVVITLKEASDSEVTLTVSSSPDAAVSNVSAFVSEYNDTMKFLNDRIKFNKAFYEDLVAQRVRTDLKHNITDNVSGQPEDYDNISDIGIAATNTAKSSLDELAVENILKSIKQGVKNSLSMPLKGSGSIFSGIEDLGIRTKDDDTLEISGEKLQSALLTNNSDVSNIFNSEGGISNRLKTQLDRELDERLGTIVFQKAAIGDTAGNIDFFLKLQEMKTALNSINERGRIISTNISVTA
jgi:flagellar hook-associated protein 2